MNILNILKSIGLFLSFWMTAAEKEFKKLPPDVQAALIEQGKFGQIVKKEYGRGVEAIKATAFNSLGMPPEVSGKILDELAAKFQLSDAGEFVDHVRETISNELDNSAWDSLWTVVTGQLQIIATDGKLNWATLAIGLTEFVYQRFIKGKI
jgi:hypothetical protein